MPSGHSTAAFAGFVFLSLYLNGKLKVFSNYHPAMWKLAAVYAPVLGATLIAGALTIDEFHHFHDILAGGIIGTVMAFSAYRMTYASVWDWRYNHIPLNRTVPFDFMAGHELSGATFTRRAGWGPYGHGGKASGEKRSWNGTRKEVPVQSGNGVGVPVAHTARPRGDEMV
jgi:membrane-associated phospholipid phosphatase